MDYVPLAWEDAKGQNVKKCVRMGITVEGISFGGYHRFYCRQLHFNSIIPVINSKTICTNNKINIYGLK